MNQLGQFFQPDDDDKIVLGIKRKSANAENGDFYKSLTQSIVQRMFSSDDSSMESLHDVASVESIREMGDELSMEAFGILDKLKAARARLPQFFDSIKKTAQSFFDFDPAHVDLIEKRTALDLSSKGNFMVIRNRKVVVPKGMKSSYLKFIDQLMKQQEMVNKLIPETLKPFEKYLAQLLDDPDRLRTAGVSSLDAAFRLHDVDGMKKDLSKHYDKDMSEYRPYGELVGRNSDWPKIMVNFNGLIDSMSSIDRKEVLKLVTIIAEHMDVLVQRMQEFPETYEPSGLTIKSLADISYAMAQEIEFYSIHAYIIEQLDVSVKSAIEIAKSVEASQESILTAGDVQLDDNRNVIGKDDRMIVDYLESKGYLYKGAESDQLNRLHMEKGSKYGKALLIIDTQNDVAVSGRMKDSNGQTIASVEKKFDSDRYNVEFTKNWTSFVEYVFDELEEEVNE